MTVIVCVDDKGGMMFGGRRQSRDRYLIADVVKGLDGALYIAEYSRLLFADSGVAFNADDDLLDNAGQGDICFVEDRELLPYLSKIERLIIYRWNRSYPRDLLLDIEPNKCGFALEHTEELAGYSHEKITKEIYTR